MCAEGEGEQRGRLDVMEGSPQEIMEWTPARRSKGGWGGGVTSRDWRWVKFS